MTDAPRLGRWLASVGITPAFIISSPARRAAQTTAAIAEQLGLSAQNIVHDRRLYLASVSSLVEVIGETSDSSQSLMVVGHNPGLESLILKWCADPLPYTDNGKLLTTANLVHLRFQQSWQHIGDRQGRLQHFIRPKELP
jgi:phosphohistidine phosphatase